jgi:hypothetical protein
MKLARETGHCERAFRWKDRLHRLTRKVEVTNLALERRITATEARCRGGWGYVDIFGRTILLGCCGPGPPRTEQIEPSPDASTRARDLENSPFASARAEFSAPLTFEIMTPGVLVISSTSCFLYLNSG